jgi:glycosyltransferase involved in cell wall biosynthesis
MYAYQQKNPRSIKLLQTKQNSGPATARNLGLEIATGEYIGFVDSDDFITPVMYEEMITACEETSSDMARTNQRVLILGIDKEYNLTIRDIMNEKDKVIPYTKICVIEDMTIDRIIQAYSVDDELNIIEIDDETDVKKDIIGVYEYVFKTSDGRIIELKDGMKMIFHNDVSDKYRNRLLTVKGVSESIKLVAQRGRPKKNR